MKSLLKTAFIVSIIFMGTTLYAQKNNRSLDNYREPDKNGINVFESPKDTISTFEKVKVRIGGQSTLQFQALDHENSNPRVSTDGGNTFSHPNLLQPISPNFNLATANLDLDVALAKGVRMHLRTYLSSRHHPEPYVKGGYFQIDNLDFISEGLLDNVMKYTTIKIGHMENNYGDAHFRRSDNAQAIYNPFVGNLIMDAFTTEVGAELYYQRNGFIGMLGMANGKLNQNVKNGNVEYDSEGNVVNEGKSGGASFLAKFGYDKQINSDLRVRLTGSLYNTGYVPSSYLYNADRAGSRYYGVMVANGASDDFRSGRYNPNLRNKITAVMFNPFVKYKGLEFFGTIETASGKADNEYNGVGEPADERKVTQFAGELVYRFGQTENFYVGARYNKVSSEDNNAHDWNPDDYTKVDIDRFQLSAGWFLTKNILMKAEYMVQNYNNYQESTPVSPNDTSYYTSAGNILEDGKFNGFVLEAAISF
ncbi:MAG: hypothetical protein CMP05_12515 [Xanthomarina sp.]|uniref:hypothetical protein n=1 Tax=Xanthomarina sp. TaxID=1931211 RepID=UPI000C396A83|nr:hypothetical protein [Xanthomarina sp.]MAL22949.1 hypothetical protein [Xanthomarina sp.]MBF62803.1 hypothetical protein [Xanthomarina sp.]|tara:strand:+ start:2562 stop:3995 length:1434 start_codon:yes stop_codon:yes gene_type:complete